MFITKAFVNKNHFLKYLVGLFVVLIVNQLGYLPFFIAVLIKKIQTGIPFPDGNDILKYLDKNLTLFLIIFSFAFSLIALWFWVKNVHNMRFMDIITSRKKIDYNKILMGFLVWTILVVASIFVDILYNPNDYVLQFEWIPFIILFLIAVFMIPIQTTTEELIFRGYLMQGFGLVFKNKLYPLIATSIIFGLVHIMNPEVEKLGYIIMVYYIGMGLFLGILTLMDEGTELAIGVHMANNIVAALLVTADWSVFDSYALYRDVSDPKIGFEVFLPIALYIPILIWFQRKYQWKSFASLISTKYQINKPSSEMS